ncbi:GTP cyclohydrolase 1 [Ancistrocladus abbreviatus]
MGALDEGHFDVELENATKLSCLELDVEEEPEIAEIEDAVKILLEGLGEDVNREGLKKTPLRVAKAFREGTRGYRQKANDIVQGALFPESGLDNGVGHAGGAGGLVIVRDLDLFSYCESCLLPFQVKCHVGYVPSEQRVVGLSKLSRVADVFAKRLQDPQRLADEVCSALHHSIKATGVAVLLQCQHIHFPSLESMFLESSIQDWVQVQVSSGSGDFENEEADVWRDFLSLLRLRGFPVDKIGIKKSTTEQCCPSVASSTNRISSNMVSTNPAMADAVVSIIRSLGEDPSRKELIGTPTRFVKWLMKFQNSNREVKLNGFFCSMLEPIKSNGEVRCNKQMHSELNLPFWSQCEHHLLPFHGVVHIGYFCAEGVNPIAKSLLQSIVHFYGFKLQVQERLTRQIAETVAPLLDGDIMVVVEASHTCMISRGIEKLRSSTATVAVLGRFATDPGARSLFLQKISSG